MFPAIGRSNPATQRVARGLAGLDEQRNRLAGGDRQAKPLEQDAFAALDGEVVNVERGDHMEPALEGPREARA